MQKSFNNELPSWRTLLSSAMLIFAHVWPDQCWWLIFFALAPWLCEIYYSPSIKAKLHQTFWLCLISQGVVCYWAVAAAQGAFQLPAVVATLAAVIFFAVSQPALYSVAALLHFVQKLKNEIFFKSLFGVLFFATAYVTAETFLPKLIPDTFGFTIYPSKILRQAADISGVRTLTLLIILINLLFTRVLLYKDNLKTIFSSVILIVSLFAFFGIYGISKIHPFPITQKIPVIAVNANTSAQLKYSAIRGNFEDRIKVVRHFIDLSELAIKKYPEAKIVIWPETAFPTIFDQPLGEQQQQLVNIVKEYTEHSKRPLIFGGFSRNENRPSYNSIFVLSPEGDLQTYRKNGLMPFSEYFPVFGNTQFAKSIFKYETSRGPNKHFLNLDFGGQKVLAIPVICYEALMSDNMRELSQQGGKLILNLTEDIWYASSTQARLHFQIAAFQSVEFRRPQFRISSSGITAAIDHFGETAELISNAPTLSDFKLLEISMPDAIEPSLYQRWGDWVSRVCVAVFFIFLILFTLTEIKSRSRS